VWTAEGGRFSLTFDQTPPTIHDCDREYTPSRQGFVIQAPEFTRLRGKRNATVATVQTDELSARLTAAMKRTEKNMRRLGKTLKEILCKMQKGSSTPSMKEATLLARQIFQTPLVQAEFPTEEPLLYAWRCLPVPVKSIKFIPSGDSCFKHPKVNITLMNDQRIAKHLHMKLKIFLTDSDFGSCEVYGTRLIRREGKLWKVYQRAGIMHEVEKVEVLMAGLTDNSTMNPISPLDFENEILTDDTSPLEWSDRLMQNFIRIKSIKETSSVTGEDEEPSGQFSGGHFTPTSLFDYMVDWLPDPPILLIKMLFYWIALKILGWHVGTWAWPMVAIKVLKWDDPRIGQDVHELRGEMRQLKQIIQHQAKWPRTHEARHSTEDNNDVNSSEDTDLIRRGTAARRTTKLKHDLHQRGIFPAGSDGN